MFDLDAYLERLGLDGCPSLAELHRAHVAAIPFENLDPHRGVPASLESEALQRKLVAGRRGGYCFEHNLLFADALEALGFAAELMRAGQVRRPARVRAAPQPPAAPRPRRGHGLACGRRLRLRLAARAAAVRPRRGPRAGGPSRSA